MSQNVQETVDHAKKWQHIEYIKSWVDEIYVNQAFYSFSLETLELTRRFNDTYRKFKKNNSEEDFHALGIISHNLEEKLLLEGTL